MEEGTVEEETGMQEGSEERGYERMEEGRNTGERSKSEWQKLETKLYKTDTEREYSR